jgi:hypothetical protein
VRLFPPRVAALPFIPNTQGMKGFAGACR